MKSLFESQPSPDISTSDASKSSQSKYDQELGSNADVFMKNSAFCCSPHGMDADFARRVLAEAVGTFILMFCICGIIANTQLMEGAAMLLESAATAGLAVIVVIFSIGTISGAHVNPAFTIAFAAFGQFPWSMVPFYILAQVGGSGLATFIGGLVYDIESNLMITRPLRGHTAAFWLEFIATFIIMFLVASLTNEAQRVDHLSGFVVGIAIGLAVLITAPVSGGSMNPARSLGPAIVSWKFDDIWIYLIAPTIGAVAGALLLLLLRVQRRPCSSTSSPNTSFLIHSIR
ncbi:probable aquaporin NIP7-1 [Cornus florida]|uniref:probable aquaporin NIP7-1 n=1 Tax=Cornus florida TaxID=4283 RepID=UPI002899D47F|nr:probable aquaporin NIP7-1 [Cornus florida]